MSEVPSRPIHKKTPNHRFTPLEKHYMAWIREPFRGRCCLSARPEFEMAHQGGYNEGKGTGLKSDVWTMLPMHHLLHKAEHQNPKTFWRNVGINNPLDYARRLFEIYENRGDPDMLLMEMHERANKDYLAEILRR